MNPGTVLLLGLLVLVVLNVRSGRIRQRERHALLERLVPGAEVVTTSGLYATVTEVHEDGTIGLESAPGVVTRWDKLAVGRIVTSPADAAVAADEPAGDEPAVEGGAATPAAAEPPVRAAEPALPDTAPPDRA